jgi:hypothetical protein
MGRGMAKSSLAELRGQIAAGEYAIDSGELAGDILSKFAVIRRVGRWLMSEDEAAAEPGRAAAPRSRGTRAAPSQPRRAPDQRLP